MSQRVNILSVQLLFALVILLGGAKGSFCADSYFYLQDDVRNSSGNRCANVFSNLIKGKEDVGGVVWSLKAINVHYLLEDYDNAAIIDRRKNNYLKLDGLLTEVEENKRAIYCKIELAMHMRKDASFRGAVYDELLNEAFQKIDTTYTSAEKSLKNENYPRAMFAFNLIAPYEDSQKMYLQARTKHKENLTENVAATPAEAAPAPDPQQNNNSTENGPIVLAAAAMTNTVVEKQAAAMSTLGPIALASRLGPITTAVNSMTTNTLPDSRNPN